MQLHLNVQLEMEHRNNYCSVVMLELDICREILACPVCAFHLGGCLVVAVVVGYYAHRHSYCS